MASTTISTAILVIAGIIMASMLSVALLSQIGIINNAIMMSSREARDRISTSIDIVHVTLNTTGSIKYIVVFIKNIGKRDLNVNEIMKTDVYVYDTSRLRLYTYNQVGYPNHWNFTEVYVDNVWSIGETLIIKIYNTSSYSTPFTIRIVLPNGVQSEYVYS